MYHHIKKLMYTVNIGEPDARFGNMLLEQLPLATTSMHKLHLCMRAQATGPGQVHVFARA